MREVLGHIFMWVIVIALMVFGYYLCGLLTLSGFVITALILVLINITKQGDGAMLSMALSAWFVIGFILRWAVSYWYA